MNTSVRLLVSFWTTFQLIGALGHDKTNNIIHTDNDEDGTWMDGLSFYNELEHGFKDHMGYGTEWIFFPDGDGIPHFVNLSMSPDLMQTRSGKLEEIEFRLYVREVSDYIILDQSAKTSEHVKIKELLSNKPVKLVTHGWMSSADKSVVIGIKDSYMKFQDAAVIGVDWSDTAMDYLYPRVADKTREVGSRVGQFLNTLCKHYDVSGDRLHLIGHSLGAHVMGIAASTSNVTIARTTGLDPARPLFEFPKKPNSLSLDSSDSELVDVIHSCSGVLGVQSPIGHADFYPNSGEAPQPGCDSIFFMLEACSHGRSHIYFAESIGNPTGFPACRSENWSYYLNNNDCQHQTYMGEYVDRNATGQYYLKTNSKEPYARSN